MDADSVIEDCLLLVQMSPLRPNEKLQIRILIRRARQAIFSPDLSEPDKTTILSALYNEIIFVCNNTTSCEITSSISFISNLLDSCGTVPEIDKAVAG